MFNRRCNESREVIKQYTEIKPEFLEIRRPVDEQSLRNELEKMLPNCNEVTTTHPDDAHFEHKLLGKMVSELHSNVNYFIVNTKCLVEMIKNPLSSLKYHNILTDEQYKKKQKCSTLYHTQRHFLPNVINRPQYSGEFLWKQI